MRAKLVPDRDELAHQVRSQIIDSNYVYTARAQVVARVLTPARAAIEMVFHSPSPGRSTWARGNEAPSHES